MEFDHAFATAYQWVRKAEGGLADDPDDMGGRTFAGITTQTWNRWQLHHDCDPDELKPVDALTDADIRDIYYHWYWLEGQCDKISDPVLALYHFDSMVQHSQAPKLLQRAAHATQDGQIGPKTLAAVSAMESPEDLLWVRIEYYADIAQLGNNHKFMRGWVKRLIHLREFARTHL